MTQILIAIRRVMSEREREKEEDIVLGERVSRSNLYDGVGEENNEKSDSAIHESFESLSMPFGVTFAGEELIRCIGKHRYSDQHRSDQKITCSYSDKVSNCFGLDSILRGAFFIERDGELSLESIWITTSTPYCSEWRCGGE